MPLLAAVGSQLEAMSRNIQYKPGYENLAYITARRLYFNVGRYIGIANSLNVPAVFIMCVHERESSGDFSTYLGNGDPLNAKTVNVPAGRGPFPDFEAGCRDAILYEGFDKVTNWSVGALCYYLIGFNGWGYYQYHGILASPYAFAGSQWQVSGKYVADEQFDPNVMDPQLGGMLVYDQLAQLDPGLALP